jgi:hypothetical protein
MESGKCAMMEAATWTVEEVDQEIRIYVEHMKLKCEQTNSA